MRCRTIRAFRDENDNNRIRFEGTIFETTNKRAKTLEEKGFVKRLDPYIEHEPEIKMEKKVDHNGPKKAFVKPKKKKKPPTMPEVLKDKK